MLKERRQDGKKDADRGLFNPPYPGSDDAQDQEENWAYKEGFNSRRKELGPRFNWA